MAAPQDMQNGSRFKTKKHGYVKVIDYFNTNTVIVYFENTGNIRAISAAKLRLGQLTDRTVPPESMMVGEKVRSVKYGTLTITQVESENIVLLTNNKGEKIRLLLATVQKMRHKTDEDENDKESLEVPTSLRDLTKRNKKARDVNTLLKKILTDYGR
ncbi:hypothetical protein [Photobacterium damselae]|uniref:hypothetical protein n=1 Tax=Photobacterium damselae TaxID=38293 RepID=UPI004068A1F7